MARGEPIWQTSSTGPTSIPNSSEAVATSAAQVAGPQTGFDDAPPRRRQAAVVGGDQEGGVDVGTARRFVLAEALRQLVGHPLGHLRAC